MLEKLKDFFYDFSDTFLSLFIILAMVLVITWKLSGAMSIPILGSATAQNKIIKTDNPPKIEKNVSDDSEDSKDTQENTNNESITEESTESNENIEVIEFEAQDIKVEIPKGTTGVGIAKILFDKGLINDKSEFINRVEELNLAPKLRFGNFTIKSNSSLDQIISIITGVKNIG